MSHEAPHEREWINYEEQHLERPKTGEKIKSCRKCEDDGIICGTVPFVEHVRLIEFTIFKTRTFSLDSIEECQYRQIKENLDTHQ